MQTYLNARQTRHGGCEALCSYTPHTVSLVSLTSSLSNELTYSSNDARTFPTHMQTSDLQSLRMCSRDTGMADGSVRSRPESQESPRILDENFALEKSP